MAYDERLLERINERLGEREDVVAKKMFGGVAFMLNGNMAVGVSGDRLMVRIAAEEHDATLALPGVSQFDLTGRPMSGWIVVESDALAEDGRLAYWIDRGLEYAGSLPPK